MIEALTLLLPLSLGGAVSPMMLTEQIVLLGTGGRRAATQFALGATLTLLAIVVVLVFIGHAIELPTEPKLSASLDIVLGVVLLGLGVAIHYLGEHPARLPMPAALSEHRLSLADRPEASFTFGAFSMATNFTTLALVIVAAKEIAAHDLDAAERIVLVLVLVTICSAPAWVPPAATRLAPRTGQRVLDVLRRLILEHGRAAVVALLLAAGAFLLARGVFNV